MPPLRSPVEKAAILGVIAAGFLALCYLLKEKGYMKQVLQPLVLAFMLVGVVSLIVEWVEFPLKLIIFGLRALKNRYIGKQKASLLLPLLSVASREKTMLTDESNLEMSIAQMEERKSVWFEGLARIAVQTTPLALQYAPPEVQNDKEVVLQAVKEDAHALWFASAKLRDDRDVVTEAVERNGLVLAAASSRLQGDSKVTLKAVTENGEALQFVNKKDHFKKKKVEQESEGKCSKYTQGVFNFKDEVEREIPSNLVLRLIAVVLTLALQYFAIFGMVTALKVQIDNIEWSGFSQGLAEVIGEVPDAALASLNATKADLTDPHKIQEMLQKRFDVGKVAGSLSGEAYKIIMQVIMCTIYSLIMLIAPMHEMSHVLGTVRSYFARKTASNLLYTIVAYGILSYLQNPLTPIIVIVTFFISYIPEIGAFITCVLPAPFFLLDNDMERNLRQRRMLIALILMIVNKFAVGNGFEAVLMGMGSAGKSTGDDRNKAGHTHPVLMIVIVLFGGTIWGATGTLFAVPATWLVQAYFREECRLYEIARCTEISMAAKASKELLISAS